MAQDGNGDQIQMKWMTTHLLSETRLAVLALSTVNESGCFSIETVQTMGLFVDKSVVLRNELPADFRRIDGGVGHYEAINEWI